MPAFAPIATASTTPPLAPISQIGSEVSSLTQNALTAGAREPFTNTYASGVADGFDPTANTPEQPNPSAGVLQWIDANYAPGSRDFDATHINQYFAHTFSNLSVAGHVIDSATLEGYVGNGHANDTLRLAQIDAQGNAVNFGYGAALADLGLAAGQTGTLTLDLSNLGGTVNLLPALNAQGWLDVLIQDDSAVDYVRLSVHYACACAGTLTEVYTTGVADNFDATANSPERPNPSTSMEYWIRTHYAYPYSRDYDAKHYDQLFAHTFSNLAKPGYTIVSATLEMPVYNGHWNDTLVLGWVDPITNTLMGYGASLSDTLGIYPGTSRNLIFDLSSLGGTMNLLPVINTNGWLDVMIQDDSVADYLRLTVQYQCTCTPYTLTYTTGVADNFNLVANSPEQPSPSAGVLAWITIYPARIPGSRNYDEKHTDQYFAHTFVKLTRPNHAIVGATLEMPVYHGHDNDTLGLHWVDAQAKMWPIGYGGALVDLGVPPYQTRTLVFDFSNLGPTSLNLLPALNAYGWFDVIMQDDSVPDYMQLTVQYACPSRQTYVPQVQR